MPDKYQFNSRMTRHRKKKNSRKTTFFVIILSLIFILLLIALIAIITSGNKDDDSVNFLNNNEEEDNNHINGGESDEDDLNDNMQDINANNEVDNNGEDEIDGSSLTTNDATENNSLDDVEIVDESEDENVIRTYIGNWAPIGTVQTGEHTTNFNDGSVDRVEIEKASSQVTGIPVDEMFVGWVGNDGHQKVFTIISNQDREEFYKLYLSWIDEEGWQVTKVEKIKEFDIEQYRN